MKLLRFMLDLKPQVGFISCKIVQVFCFDQCNARDGYTDRQRYATERLDADGENVISQSTTFITSYRIHMPQALLNLNDEDVARLKRHGPFLKDWSKLIPWLQPSRVKADLWRMLDETTSAFRRQMADNRMSSVNPAQAARILFGRHDVDPGGVTPIEILPVILNCDTASYADNNRIWSHLESHCVPDDNGEMPAIVAARMDGGSLLTSKNGRNRFRFCCIFSPASLH